MKSSGYVPVIIVLLLAFWSPSLFAQSKASTVEKLVLSRTVIDEELQKRYKAELSKIENRRRAVANYRKEKGHLPGQMEEELIGYFSKVSKEWLSTRWALGNPQASLPGTKDPINCGTFVGRVLNDMGFQVKVSKLQRQPAQLIIQSFVGKKRIESIPIRTWITF